MGRSVVVIGAGFSGLSSALYLAKNGYQVDVLEKNVSPGGRARKFEENGFKFNLGTGFYWLPEIFENFFADFNHSSSDFYQLTRLDPAYRVFFGKNDFLDIPGYFENTLELFDSLEKDGAKKLKKYIHNSEISYNLGKPDFDQIHGNFFAGIFGRFSSGYIGTTNYLSCSKQIRSLFKEERLIKLLEFPLLFFGAIAQKTTSLYRLMNYADLKFGTWYPEGGFYSVIEAMLKLAEEFSVSVHTNTAVEAFEIVNNKVRSATAHKKSFFADNFIATADYHHIDNDILGEKYRNHSEKYWDKKSMAPSAFLIHLGLNKKIENLLHHNLLFDTDFNIHARQIFTEPKWPSDPAIYVSCPSKTDKSVAPEGCENLVILIPVAPNLQDSGKVREHYLNLALCKIEGYTNENIRDHIVSRRTYAHTDFTGDYNSYKGNAYGLSNILSQTSPSITHNHIGNLSYAGQLNLGPGVPSSLLGGKMVAKHLMNHF